MSDRATGLGDAAPRHALELRGISRQFGALVALADVTLIVAPGERRAILGSNGAGKTTLFNCLTGDFSPTAGQVRFFDEDVTFLPVHKRIRRGLRRTYQSPVSFRGLTVRESLFLAVRGVSRRRFSMRRPTPDDAAMEAVLRLAHTAHLEQQLDRVVGNLSHGELRQLELGMALAGVPRLILFDEPAAGLSPAERGDLVDTLKALPSHMGFVIIEHDLDVALRVAGSVTVLHQARVFREGNPDEIEADEEVQRIYLGGHGG
jgi:branched-chain amino acid transport system ATP-binding protein